MKKFIFSILAILFLASTAFAHRLNEYLEATTISLSQGKISLELRLTPGVAVARDLLNIIDLNNDKQISAAEQQTYLKALLHDLSLKIDKHETPLQVVSSTFPTAEAMEKGTGDIIVDFEASIFEKTSAHQLQFKNIHFNTVGVYLTNCLLPADTAIQVTSQTRSADQSVYTLDFTIGGLKKNTASIQLGQPEPWAITKTFLLHGIRHILTGYDHLLFLCALVLGAASLWNLIKIVTAFTIAHSITLTLATFGFAHLPPAVVEPIIATSIVFVAIQNIALPKQANGNIRLAVAFFFGLFHGFGFAGGLLELMHAMPAGLIWYAILGFSIGVEAGNQLILLPLYFAIKQLKETKTQNVKTRPYLVFQQYAYGAIAIAGIYYFITDIYTFYF